MSGTGLTDTKTVEVTPGESLQFMPQVVGTSSGFTQDVMVSAIQGNTNITDDQRDRNHRLFLSNGCNGAVLTPATTCASDRFYAPARPRYCPAP